MTSETEALKTNEFQRRRKLRLQQVREQSKDIAKKIRQRAKVEKLRQVVDLDAKKQKEYFDCQEKLVKRLEVLYAKGLQNVGASHNSASELTQQDEAVKTDLSKLRGKEATAQLRRKKQEKLDQQKKLLDRKVQAREVANEISRDKSSVISNKLLSKASSTKLSDECSQKAGGYSDLPKESDKEAGTINNEAEAVKTSDMATQWDMENMREWEPAVPALSLTTDKDTPKDSEDFIGNQADKSKRLDLFALSKEMPSSLRGGKHTHEIKEREPGRPSLTIVSEYLQNRKLRLREPEPAFTNKKTPDDMQSLKQMIQRTRAAKPEGLDKSPTSTKKGKDTPANQRKGSILMYNHSTRDTRDLPYGYDKLVVRDPQSEEDAYSQAMKEMSSFGGKDKEQKKIQDMRNKVAVTKQNVEKEYKDTMNFLNSLPKDNGSKVIKNAYMDEHRQQMQQESRQQKMQQEYRKIEKEYRKHNCSKRRNQSKSPTRLDIDEDFDSRDFQYSWMPVPETDGNLAIHAIPNTVKQGKSGNSVKFSQVDSYHEYRSRHKHTPPTKDTTQDKPPVKRIFETVRTDNNTSESSDNSSVTSDTSSVVNMKIEMRRKHKNAKEINQNLSDAERIIIYKVLDSKTEKKSKRQAKLLNEIVKSLTSIEKVHNQKTMHVQSPSKSAGNGVSFEQLNEGIYKMVEQQGDNVASMYFDARDQVPAVRSEGLHTRSCRCKNPCKSQQCNRGPVLQWESGDCLAPASIPNKSQCPSVPKEKLSGTIPSDGITMPPTFAPSTSSYTTAINDKGTSEGGYIKLVDETGHEAKTIYLGSSGVLNNNNNAYEVVIQLRKKDEMLEEKIPDDTTVTKQDTQPESKINTDHNINNRPASSQNDLNDVQPPSDGGMQNVKAYRSEIDKQSVKIPPQPDLTSASVRSETPNMLTDNKAAKCDIETNTEGSVEMYFVQSTSESERKKDISEKGVNTSEAPKVDQLPRPSTNTCTQTTLSSPIHRPVFFHMSSSTSTAYMSPPEMILPKSLRRDCAMTERETYDPIHTLELIGKEYRQENSACRCRKCILAKRAVQNKINLLEHCTKKNYENQQIVTPPNTAHHTPELHQNHNVLKEKNMTSKGANIDKPKCKHRNRRYVDHLKEHCSKNKGPSAESTVVGIDFTSRNRYKFTSSRREKKSNQSRLNPIIRDYVNKLLALNREGLKAVEVADQECSSVGTPGSSIINVPFNVDERKISVINTISLEQIKSLLKRQIMEEEQAKDLNYSQNSYFYSVPNAKNNMKRSTSRTSRKKPVHKVKSLNITKHFLKQVKTGQVKSKNPASQSSTEGSNKVAGSHAAKKSRSKSPPTPRQVYMEPFSRFNEYESTFKNSTGTDKTVERNNKNKLGITTLTKTDSPKKAKCNPNMKRHRTAAATESTADSESTEQLRRFQNSTDIPISMSTQTTQNIDINTDTNFMKLAEDKLHNMEKIADLTEKCTKRLSNLAKVLEEVRKNKSLAYSQISSAESNDSQPDPKSEKPVVSPITDQGSNNVSPRLETKSPEPIPDKESAIESEIPPPDHNSILTDIPRPVFETLESRKAQHPKFVENLDSSLQLSTNAADILVKNRPKPPPALSRLSLKHGQEYIIPHELSTVIEVDSPISMKQKSQSARNDVKEASINSNRSSPQDKTVDDNRKSEVDKDHIVNPDLLQTKSHISKMYKLSSTESSDESKFQMIDLKQFNEIMLEPFISIQEYAKKYNMEPPDEGSNLEDIQRDVNDDISSLHSDGSLPDVIAELLKRNIITEPFKFDTASNINSTTISSESTLSMLALSKARKGKKRPNVVCQNKENIGETSDTLSFSSNPDLENAFKKLGMGWASSTLKKTKERLALSSSSNTSSSSLSQFKTKYFNQEVPALVTDSVSKESVCKGTQLKNAIDNSKNAEQQTTFSNSMTVKEFLRNELAKKITFTNKSNVNDTNEEFVSLFETKMPAEMKESSLVNRDDRSVESARSGTNRARTSTPVQLFKSFTYHSSSSSNISNGLFSNADDLSSVKMTSNSNQKHSTSDKDDLTIPTFSLRMKINSDCSKSD